ncbi:MAG: glycerophosphodiester phosphodiesterase [Pleomorphochaeta sp.]
MKTYAHRGFSGLYPENTMIAFKKAVEECKCDGIELDVHLSKDDELVIIHDEKVDRTTSGKGYVKDKTLEELKELNANYMFNNLAEIQRVPTFDEYCEYIQDKNIITNIEIKTNLIYYKDIEEKVINKLKRYNLSDRVILSSFNHGSAVISKKIKKDIKCGLLVESPGIINSGYFTKMLGMECYHPDINCLSEEIVNECKKYEIEVNTWTVNTMKNLINCINWGVDGLITNYPNVVKSCING